MELLNCVYNDKLKPLITTWSQMTLFCLTVIPVIFQYDKMQWQIWIVTGISETVKNIYLFSHLWLLRGPKPAIAPTSWQCGTPLYALGGDVPSGVPGTFAPCSYRTIWCLNDVTAGGAGKSLIFTIKVNIPFLSSY